MRLLDRLRKHDTSPSEPVVVPRQVPREPEPVDTSREEARAWARAAVEAKDWAALVAVLRSKDYSRQFNKSYRALLAKEALREAGSEAIDALIAELRTPGVGTDDIARVLADIGDARAVEPLLAVFEDVAPYGGAQDAIVEFLGRIAAKKAAPALVRYLDSGYPPTRMAAARGLGLLAVEKTRPALQDALANDGDDIRRGLLRADTEFARSLVPKATGSYRSYIVEGDVTRGPVQPGMVRIGSAGFDQGYAAGWLDWDDNGTHDCVRDLGHSHATAQEAETCLTGLTATWKSKGIEVDRE